MVANTIIGHTWRIQYDLDCKIITVRKINRIRNLIILHNTRYQGIVHDNSFLVVLFLKSFDMKFYLVLPVLEQGKLGKIWSIEQKSAVGYRF